MAERRKRKTRLSDEQRNELFRTVQAGTASLRAIAKTFDISYGWLFSLLNAYDVDYSYYSERKTGLSDEQRNELIALGKAKLGTLQEIAECYGISRERVRQILVKHDITSRQAMQTWVSDETQQDWADLYELGFSMRSIHLAYSQYSYSTIFSCVKRMGVRVTSMRPREASLVRRAKGVKTCKDCQQELAFAYFYQVRTVPSRGSRLIGDGYMSRCKTCFFEWRVIYIADLMAEDSERGRRVREDQALLAKGIFPATKGPPRKRSFHQVRGRTALLNKALRMLQDKNAP